MFDPLIHKNELGRNNNSCRRLFKFPFGTSTVIKRFTENREQIFCIELTNLVPPLQVDGPYHLNKICQYLRLHMKITC